MPSNLDKVMQELKELALKYNIQVLTGVQLYIPGLSAEPVDPDMPIFIDYTSNVRCIR